MVDDNCSCADACTCMQRINAEEVFIKGPSLIQFGSDKPFIVLLSNKLSIRSWCIRWRFYVLVEKRGHWKLDGTWI